MLHNVAEGINRMARNIVSNHPNTFNCRLVRKVILRKGEEIINGNPTMGGLAVLNAADEEEYKYIHLGDGFTLEADTFSPALMTDRKDVNIGSRSEFRFLIEPEEEPGSEGWFDVKIGDIMFVMLGYPDPAWLAFEIVGYETTINIPPYSSRYIANIRDDLHIPAKHETETS